MTKTNLLELLDYIHPSSLDYQEWLNVGMALKHEGYSISDWEEWSRKDSKRFKQGECTRKWHGFTGTGVLVTGGTIWQMATDNGWVPKQDAGRELDWDDYIGGKDDLIVIDKGWIESKEVLEPANWNPANEIIRYLEVLFEAGENVGYVTESWEKDGRFLPTKGAWDRTAGELIQALSKCKGDVGAVIGDYNKDAGAWVRFNPMDGKGCKNENVADYRYALVESDDMEIDKQNAIIRELELPVACLMFSGKKSLHAIVKVEAADYDEYRKRVDYLYKVCKKNGLGIDTQNKNPSRLSRLPGVERGDKKQFIVDTNIGQANWNEWYEWIESINDDLPDPESLTDVWDNIPDLATPLIDGVLRMGHKMLIAGPSKSGKSFALIQLCVAIAEGKRWLGWPCTKGKVLYLNLELDRASCLHRFKDVYQALNLEPKSINNIDIWNLRGKSIPMDKLAPKLIRRAAKKDYVAIVIDPIYKVITGDENSADQMARFCNQFDTVCTELGCSVIYCHHHSKGSQGGKKSMDRASGSGVFARDPDALLDLIELEVTDGLIKREEDKAICDTCVEWLEEYKEHLLNELSQDDMCSSSVMLDFCAKELVSLEFKALSGRISFAKKVAGLKTAWRIDGTLREFPKFNPVNLWFDYPVHRFDPSGALRDMQPEEFGQQKGWKKIQEKNEASQKEKNTEFEKQLELSSSLGEYPTVDEMAKSLGVTARTIKNRLRKNFSRKYEIDKNSGQIKPLKANDVPL